MATINKKDTAQATSSDVASIQEGDSSFCSLNSTFEVSEQIRDNNDIDKAAENEQKLKENTIKSHVAVSTDKNVSDSEGKDRVERKVQEKADLVTQGDESFENLNSNQGATIGFSPIKSKVQKVSDDNFEESEQEDCDDDVLTGSYGEISLEHELMNYDKNSDSNSSKDDEQFILDEIKVPSNGAKEKKRPDSLVLTQNVVKNLEELVKNQEHTHVHQSQQTSDCRTTSAEISPSFSSEEYAVHSSGRVRTGSDTSGLSELQGTLTIDGDLVTFVAEDLQEKIKMSSPVSRWTDSSFPGSRSSTPSLYRQALQPNLHIVDPTILTDLEAHAKKVATCVDTMLENLSGTLQSISSLTVDCMETYESSVCKTCDAVDMNIKAVYQLMAKCEELSNAMNPLYRMSGDIKHIKKMLEQLEHTVEHKS